MPNRSDLIKEWQSATQRLKEAEQEKNAADICERNARSALGKAFIPEHSTEVQNIRVFLGESGLDIDGKYVMSVTRSTGDSFDIKIAEMKTK